MRLRLRLAAVLLTLPAAAPTVHAQPLAPPPAFLVDTAAAAPIAPDTLAAARAVPDSLATTDTAVVPASVVLRPDVAVERMPVDTPPCRYEACALRVDTGLTPRIVRGRDEVPVLRIGFSTPHLTDLVADAPEAVPHAREFERTHLPLQVVATTGLGLSVLSILPGVSTGTRTMSMLGSVLLTLASRPLLAQNRRALERAIWEYNATLAR